MTLVDRASDFGTNGTTARLGATYRFMWIWMVVYLDSIYNSCRTRLRLVPFVFRLAQYSTEFSMMGLIPRFLFYTSVWRAASLETQQRHSNFRSARRADYYFRDWQKSSNTNRYSLSFVFRRLSWYKMKTESEIPFLWTFWNCICHSHFSSKILWYFFL